MSDDPRREPDEKTTQKRPATQPAMQAQPRTRELPALTDRALLEDMARTQKELLVDIKNMRGDMDLMMGDVGTLKVDVRELQRWKIDTEDRGSTHSGGIRQLTGNDQKQDAAIATIIVTQEEHTAKFETLEMSLKANTEATLALKTALIDDVRGFFKNHPQVGQALIGLVMLFIGYLAAFLKAHQ